MSILSFDWKRIHYTQIDWDGRHVPDGDALEFHVPYTQDIPNTSAQVRFLTKVQVGNGRYANEIVTDEGYEYKSREHAPGAVQEVLSGPDGYNYRRCLETPEGPVRIKLKFDRVTQGNVVTLTHSWPGDPAPLVRRFRRTGWGFDNLKKRPL
jgi:hypothetical protein